MMRRIHKEGTSETSLEEEYALPTTSEVMTTKLHGQVSHFDWWAVHLAIATVRVHKVCDRSACCLARELAKRRHTVAVQREKR